MVYTLTYSNSSEGWPSFYSFQPDWMIGMNNYFYTFKGGDLYIHNSDLESRNTFYRQWYDKFLVPPPPGATVASNLIGVFNEAPLQNKLFKTIKLDGDSTWTGTFTTDIQNSGYVLASWFEKKEQSYFAFIRNDDQGQLSQRSVNGIGKSASIDTANFPYTEINFSINPLVDIGSIISIGDIVYFADAPYTTTNNAGPVVDIIRDYRNGINRLIVDSTFPAITPTQNDSFYYYVKNSVAESHGVLGHYCVFNINNSSTGKIELFTIGSEVMKSYP